jgi:hypothetical protein
LSIAAALAHSHAPPAAAANEHSPMLLTLVAIGQITATRVNKTNISRGESLLVTVKLPRGFTLAPLSYPARAPKVISERWLQHLVNDLIR